MSHDNGWMGEPLQATGRESRQNFLNRMKNLIKQGALIRAEECPEKERKKEGASLLPGVKPRSMESRLRDK